MVWTNDHLGSCENFPFNVNPKTLRYNMAIWVVEFSNGGTKLERFLPNNQHAQRKLLNFENWVNEGLRSFQKSEF